MQLNYSFKQMESSEALLEHVEHRLTRIEHFENRPMYAKAVFSMTRERCHVEIRVVEGKRSFKASGDATDFFHAVDQCVDRLVAQVAKKKRVVRSHKSPDRSNEGLMELLQPDLTYDFAKFGKRAA